MPPSLPQPWPLQDAKNRFSELVDRAIAEGPQIVTRRGKEAVVVVSASDYRRQQAAPRDFVDFLLSAPRVELDLRRDSAPDRETELE